MRTRGRSRRARQPRRDVKEGGRKEASSSLASFDSLFSSFCSQVKIYLSAPYMGHIQVEGEDPAGWYFGVSLAALVLLLKDPKESSRAMELTVFPESSSLLIFFVPCLSLSLSFPLPLPLSALHPHRRLVQRRDDCSRDHSRVRSILSSFSLAPSLDASLPFSPTFPSPSHPLPSLTDCLLPFYTLVTPSSLQHRQENPRRLGD